MANLLKLVLGYSTVLLPQIYAVLQNYNAQHPNPQIALVLSVLGAIVLHGAKPPVK